MPVSSFKSGGDPVRPLAAGRGEAGLRGLRCPAVDGLSAEQG